jgi:predicted PilT family ATPase
MKLSALGRQGLAHNAAVVEKMWEQIENAVASLPITAGTVRVYQDGLPVCGHEQDIVSELAGAGSRNHRTLLELQARGATLMGTESPELLVQEYQLATAGFASGVTVRMEVRQKQLRDTLLEKRDAYIADRINGTLGAGESGILFMGMLHAVAKYLDADINVVYPLGPPRVEQRKGV